MFEVSSIGFVLQRDLLTIITDHEAPALNRTRARAVGSLHDLVLRELLDIVRHFVDHLRAIKMISSELQSKLNTSIGNEFLLRMFSVSESLIYYVNAIDANGVTLAKLRTSAERIGFSTVEMSLIDDLIIENTQCLHQATIYSEVLSGLMDSRGNIVNNNMNILIKNLTIVNVIFLPLGVLAGVGGMSEFSMMTGATREIHGWPWWYTYPLFLLGLTVVGILTWYIVSRWIIRSISRS
jgi:magnesium transporter